MEWGREGQRSCEEEGRERREGELAGRYCPGKRDKLTVTGSREASGVSSMNSWKQRWARAQGLEA